MLLGDQEYVEVGPQRAAHVGQQEIDGVERAWVEPPPWRDQRHRPTHHVPISSVMMVSGAPTRK